MIRALTAGTIAGVVLGVAPFGADRRTLTTPALLTEKAPEIYRAKLETSKGPFVIEVHRAWAPLGVDRFYNLVKNGFYDDCRFFRVIDRLIAQVGIHGDTAIQSAWATAVIPDDSRRETFRRGYVALASAGPHSRSTQFFIALASNAKLFDRQGLAPFGQVVSGMDVADSLYSGYGEGAPRGKGPEQAKIQMEGNAYLNKGFPKLDFIKKTTIEK